MVSRNLWIYASANAVSRFGSQFQFLAITALTYAITKSPMATAVQMAATGLPFVLLARWAGVPADRYDPRRVVIAMSLVQAFLTLGYLLSSHVAWFTFLSFLVSTASVFMLPARRTL
ncbi:MAG TPA: MFS transporter, partial [Symbiobacteriaceae bacterium]|nr:MFS transporter [Symbiobacteriaceae bacterium]